MKPYVYVGIDPGLDGAIAGIREDNSLIFVEDMPVTLKGSGMIKREVNAPAVCDILRNYSIKGVLLERVNAMPGQGVSSVFSLGDSYGSLRAVVAALSIPLFVVMPTVWKKYYKLERDKEYARALASRLYPTAPLKYKKHADRAEAILMANYLREKDK